MTEALQAIPVTATPVYAEPLYTIQVLSDTPIENITEEINRIGRVRISDLSNTGKRYCGYTCIGFSAATMGLSGFLFYLGATGQDSTMYSFGPIMIVTSCIMAACSRKYFRRGP